MACVDSVGPAVPLSLAPVNVCFVNKFEASKKKSNVGRKSLYHGFLSVNKQRSSPEVLVHVFVRELK